MAGLGTRIRGAAGTSPLCGEARPQPGRLVSSAAAGRRSARGSIRVCAEPKGEEQPPQVARRSLLQGLGVSGALAAVPELAPGPAQAGTWYTLPPSTPPGRVVVITGANSGIGYAAAKKMASAGYEVHLVCRTLAKASAAGDRIAAELAQADVPMLGRTVPHQCDLSSLEQVRAFSGRWVAAERPIDVLALNAGLQYTGLTEPLRTADGFELTVGVNHLAHFLMANLLLPALQQRAASVLDAGGPKPRIVITASEVHDPASPGGAVGKPATLGDLSGLIRDGAAFSMIDGGDYDAEKAYKDSKLCNVLFARKLAADLAAGGGPADRISVNAFGPGLITRTGFFRNQNPVFVKLFDFAANDLLRVAETPEGGGDCLAYMALEPVLEGVSGVYYNNDLAGFGGHRFTRILPSAEAQRADQAEVLWRESARLVGLA